MLGVDDQRDLAPIVIVAHPLEACRAVMMIGGGQEHERARAPRLRDSSVVPRDVEHHGYARSVVHGAFEECIGVGHDEDLLIAGAGQHAPNIARLYALTLLDIELEVK